jgi:hypothetical protein
MLNKKLRAAALSKQKKRKKREECDLLKPSQSHNLPWRPERYNVSRCIGEEEEEGEL